MILYSVYSIDGIYTNFLCVIFTILLSINFVMVVLLWVIACQLQGTSKWDMWLIIDLNDIECDRMISWWQLRFVWVILWVSLTKIFDILDLSVWFQYTKLTLKKCYRYSLWNLGAVERVVLAGEKEDWMEMSRIR